MLIDNNAAPVSVSLARVRELCADGDAKAVRERARLSVADIARDINVARSLLGRWEDGTVRPTGKRALAYLELLEALDDLHAPGDNGVEGVAKSG